MFDKNVIFFFTLELIFFKCFFLQKAIFSLKKWEKNQNFSDKWLTFKSFGCFVSFRSFGSFEFVDKRIIQKLKLIHGHISSPLGLLCLLCILCLLSLLGLCLYWVLWVCVFCVLLCLLCLWCLWCLMSLSCLLGILCLLCLLCILCSIFWDKMLRGRAPKFYQFRNCNKFHWNCTHIFHKNSQSSTELQ